jgi:hypothetical protein
MITPEVFKRLGLYEPIRLIGLPGPFFVVDKFDCDKKIEVTRHKNITPETLFKWSLPDGNPIAKLEDLERGKLIIHLPSGFEYMVDLVRGSCEYASAMHMRVVSIEEAKNWELYKKDDD